MARRVAAILLTLSLATFLAATADDMTSLPNEGQGATRNQVTPAVKAGRREKLGDGDEKPWKCCDISFCPLIYPPFCFCMDEVERCDDACKNCEQAGGDPPLYVCRDRYYSNDPVPRCTNNAAVAASVGSN